MLRRSEVREKIKMCLVLEAKERNNFKRKTVTVIVSNAIKTTSS